VDKIFKIVGGFVVLGLVVALIVWLTHDSKRKLSPILEELSEEVSTEFAEKLPRNRQVNDLLMILPRSGNIRDEELRFRDILKNDIVKARKYNVSDWEDVKKKVGDTFIGKVLTETGLVPGDDPKNLDQAVKIMKRLSAANQNFDGVLLVYVKDFDEGQEGLHAKVSVDGEIYGVAAATTIEKVPPVARSVDSVMNYTYLHHRIESMSIFLRFFGWFLVAATMPFALIQLVRAVVTKRKNELNLALIASFTIIDVLLAWILISAMSFGMGTTLFALLLAGLLGYYNYDACDYIERRLT
jgi:hypothetical protein